MTWAKQMWNLAVPTGKKFVPEQWSPPDEFSKVQSKKHSLLATGEKWLPCLERKTFVLLTAVLLHENIPVSLNGVKNYIKNLRDAKIKKRARSRFLLPIAAYYLFEPRVFLNLKKLLIIFEKQLKPKEIRNPRMPNREELMEMVMNLKSTLEAERASRVKEVRALKNQLTLSTHHLENARNSSQGNSELEKLMEEMRSLKKTLKETKKELETTKRSKRHFTNSRDKIKLDLDNIECCNCKSIRNDQEKQIEQYKEQIGKVEKEIEECRSQVDDLSRQIDDLEKENLDFKTNYHKICSFKPEGKNHQTPLWLRKLIMNLHLFAVPRTSMSQVVSAVMNAAVPTLDVKLQLPSESTCGNLRQETMIVNDIVSAIVFAKCERIIQVFHDQADVNQTTLLASNMRVQMPGGDIVDLYVRGALIALGSCPR